MWTINLLSTVHFPTTKNLPRWDPKQILFKIIFYRMALDGRQLLSEHDEWKNELASKFVHLLDLSRVIEKSMERRRRVEELLTDRNHLAIASRGISQEVSYTLIDSREISKPRKKQKKRITTEKPESTKKNNEWEEVDWVFILSDNNCYEYTC